mmetsp:Transcript_29644/g.61881  ORF Transcript_29644/g.61881 Transcript_29644/m.61881 type:complete len:260 (+) Transcript_29644:530-1309(+)
MGVTLVLGRVWKKAKEKIIRSSQLRTTTMKKMMKVNWNIMTMIATMTGRHLMTTLNGVSWRMRDLTTWMLQAAAAKAMLHWSRGVNIPIMNGAAPMIRHWAPTLKAQGLLRSEATREGTTHSMTTNFLKKKQTSSIMPCRLLATYWTMTSQPPPQPTPSTKTWGGTTLTMTVSQAASSLRYSSYSSFSCTGRVPREISKNAPPGEGTSKCRVKITTNDIKKGIYEHGERKCCSYYIGGGTIHGILLLGRRLTCSDFRRL